MENDETAEPGSILAMLGLTPEEFGALKRQGSVTGEIRGPRSIVYKLRFRVAGKQRVRYLGTDPALADAVRQELRELQFVKSLNGELRKLIGEARKSLREGPRLLAEHVMEMGLKFHGRQIRRPRRGQ